MRGRYHAPCAHCLKTQLPIWQHLTSQIPPSLHQAGNGEYERGDREGLAHHPLDQIGLQLLQLPMYAAVFMRRSLHK
jgi:hypothetical protein